MTNTMLRVCSLYTSPVQLFNTALPSFQVLLHWPSFIVSHYCGPSPEDMLIDFRQRGRERERETLNGCLPYVPRLGIELDT